MAMKFYNKEKEKKKKRPKGQLVQTMEHIIFLKLLKWHVHL